MIKISGLLCFIIALGFLSSCAQNNVETRGTFAPKAKEYSGGIISLTGIVGTGKTAILRRIQEVLQKEGETIICRSLSTDKRRVNINTLYISLFADIPTKKDFNPPVKSELRERALQNITKEIKKPIALFIDNSHQLHGNTLIGLKNLIETVEESSGTLTIILCGHPILANSLRKPTMEEVGARAKFFNTDCISENKVDYIKWILKQCTYKNTNISDIITDYAITLLADRLVTPLQINYYLIEAFSKAYMVGIKPVDEEVINSVLSPDIDGLQEKLSRNGYKINDLCTLFGAKPSAVRAYFKGNLQQDIADSFSKEINKLGII